MNSQISAELFRKHFIDPMMDEGVQATCYASRSPSMLVSNKICSEKENIVTIIN